jgi:hypothetical protein
MASRKIDNSHRSYQQDNSVASPHVMAAQGSQGEKRACYQALHTKLYNIHILRQYF